MIEEVKKIEENDIIGLTEVVADKVNEIVDFLKPFSSLQGKNGITVVPSDSNIVFNFSSSVVTGSVAEVTYHPFKLLDVSTSGSLKIRVYHGYVNGEMPTMGGTSLNHSTPPTDTITATTYYWLKADAEFSDPSSGTYTVETTTTSTPPSGTTITGTGFVSYNLIGLASVYMGDITDIAQYVKENQHVDSYGAVNIWWG